MGRKLFFSLLAGLFAVTSCTKKDAKDGSAPSQMLDVSYAAFPKNKMDVYLPANRSRNTPVIFVIHGGGHYFGDKRDYSPICNKLYEQGYAVVNINYRLADTSGTLSVPIVHKPSAITISHQLSDIRSALQFTATNSVKWMINHQNFAFLGHSAGGTLSMLYAYGKNDVRVKALASWAGATDLSFPDESTSQVIGPYFTEIAYRITGFELRNENRDAYKAVSPYWVLSSGSGKPTLNLLPENNIVHRGLPDNSVAQYNAITSLLNLKGTPNSLQVVKGGDHNFSKPGNFEFAMSQTLNFFLTYLPK